MECAKRYSASNIKKKSKGEKLGTSKKKSRTTAQVKAVKTVAAPAPQQVSGLVYQCVTSLYIIHTK